MESTGDQASASDRAKLDVLAQRAHPHQLGQRSGGEAAVEIHLPETIAGVEIALRERGIRVALGKYVPRSVGVEDHLDGLLEARERKALSVGLILP